MGSDDLIVEYGVDSLAVEESKSEKDISSESIGSVQTKVVYEGWLNKRGEYIQNWRKRYFLLMDNGQFLGFRTKPSNDKDITDPENNFTIRNCTIFPDNKPKPFTFTIRLLHGTTIVERVFSVDSEQERLTWTTLIEEVKFNLQKEKSKMTPSEATSSKTAKDTLNIDDTSLSGHFPNHSSTKQRKKKITFENFEFLKVLGKGTYGKVILCRERATMNLYAMKIIKKEMVIFNDNIDQILAEKRVLQKTNHPFLLDLKYSFTTCDHLCLVTEFVNGGELYFQLAKELKQGNPFSEDRARFYGAEIICALEYLHKNAIIHRDLKLENILLDKDGHIRIIDFGLCKENIQWNCETRSLIGTPEYRAPEIIVHDYYGKVVDWWAFGIIMCEMLVGKNPFYDEDRDVMFENVLEVDIIFPRWLSDSARDLLSGLLNKEPHNRLGSGEEGSNLIKNHDFFESIDWDALVEKKIDPPFKPEVENEGDTRNFDVQFTGESVRLTPPPVEEEDGLSIPMPETNLHRQLFRQFSYQSNYSSDTLNSSQQSVAVVY